MTDEQWADLKPFVEADANARQRMASFGMINLPIDARKAIEAEVEFDRVKTEAHQAALELAIAKERILGLPSRMWGQYGAPLGASSPAVASRRQ